MNSEKPQASPWSAVILFLGYWLPPLLYAVLIFYLSSLPGTTYFPQFFSADKILHVAEYGLLGYLLARALGRSPHRKAMLFFTAASLSVLYGISDEIHQYFVPFRCSSVMDVVADGLGASLGSGIYIKNKG